MVRNAAQAALMAIALGLSATSAFAHDANRDLVLPIQLRHNVDLVLQGHDHTYARGLLDADAQEPRLRGFAAGDKLTTMFVNSVSSPRQNQFGKQGRDEHAPMRRFDNTLPYKGPNF